MFGSEGDRIVSLATRKRSTSREECFVELDAYWTALAAGRIVPLRDEVDPRGIKGSLDKVFLIERIAPGIARFRIAGHHLTDLMGMEMRGMPLSAAFTPAAREQLGDTLRALFSEPARVELTLEGQRQGLRGRIGARALFLPLRNRDGGIDRAIGMLSSTGRRGTAPQRFDIVGEERRTLVGYGEYPLGPSGPTETEIFVPAETARARIRNREELRASLRVVSSNAGE